MNHFHYRARIDHLWRRCGDRNPGYIRMKALKTVLRELFARTPQSDRNYQLYLATDPFDVARHKLRDLYDHASPALRTPLPLGERRGEDPAASPCLPLPLGEGWGEGPAALEEEQPTDEDADPL